MSTRVSNLLGTESETDESNERPALEGTGGGRNARLGSAVLGGALLAYGLRRRSVIGGAASVAGGWLLYRGLGDRVDLEGGIQSASGVVESVRELSTSDGAGEPTSVARTITVGKPADELAERWRDPETLAQVVAPVADVSEAGEDRLQWTVEGPTGRSLEWETDVIEERPGELLRWEAVEGTAVSAEGSVRFRPAPRDQGTEVTLELRFDTPGGAVVAGAFEQLGFVPDVVARMTLRRFKSLVETGEIPTLERNPSARGKGDLV